MIIPHGLSSISSVAQVIVRTKQAKHTARVKKVAMSVPPLPLNVSDQMHPAAKIQLYMPARKSHDRK